MLDQVVVVRELFVLLAFNTFRQNEDLTTGTSGVVPAARLQVSVVKNPGRLVVVWTVHVMDDPES